MVSTETIDKLVRVLVAASSPTKVILFGSYARGDARDDSDIDLLIVEPVVRSKRSEMVRLRRKKRFQMRRDGLIQQRILDPVQSW